jgi:hypothetical protein
MTMMCEYSDNRESVLIDYLYDEMTPAERDRFAAHVSACSVCRMELAELDGVRTTLGKWAPPEPQIAARRSALSARPLRSKPIPVWAQFAAAVLVVGVAAGIANVDVHYDRAGLSIRTGWSKPSSLQVQNPAIPAGAAQAPWHGDLTALEERLRSEFRQAELQSAAAARVADAHPAGNEAMMRRVRALVEQSEQRQQSELALRLAALTSEMNRRREGDLIRIGSHLGQIQDRTTVTERQLLGYIQQVSIQK